MSEIVHLPEIGRSADFMAEFTLTEEKGALVATEGWINAPHRGQEIMGIISNKLQEIASSRGQPVIHRYEASTPEGRTLIQKYPEYHWAGRSSDHNPIYEKEYQP